jgi:alanyl-tRNA synthetase
VPVLAQEIRDRFAQFFAARGHQVVESSPLVPQNDPTLFFTNAGMVQFKDVFTGQEARDYRRAVSVQKCLRVSGKHNDLENVGRTPRHHTFFEMLGNFSFGDYFKAEAIEMAWQFLTGELGLDKRRLWVTIYEEDDEAGRLWVERTDVDPSHIQRLGKKDNFWSMGDTGPCGPCSEIHYDHGPAFGDDERGPAFESGRYIEIWNLVFMQFDRSADGVMTPLPRPSIDTGMGLERVAAILQGFYNNYDTDGFSVLVEQAAALSGVRLGADPESDVALRVIADHARATAHLVADGVMPSNEERGYVLRRIMRRAIRYGVKLGLQEPFLFAVVDRVVDHMGGAYPNLVERRDFIREVVKGEEERFATTLAHGLALLNQEADALVGDARVLAGEVVFKLHDTYGFPPDLTGLILAERGIGIDEAGYQRSMEAQRAAGRAAWKGSGAVAVGDLGHQLAAALPATRFTGYAADAGPARVLALVQDGARVAALPAGGRGALVADETPFYAESGGQAGDTGAVEADGGLRARVLDTRKGAGGLVLHEVEVLEGTLREGQPVQLRVDADRRDRTRKNHTATHLLHAALRTVLGDHVVQKGSLVEADRLRFDFAHHKPMTPEELTRVEDLVYAEVLRNTAVEVDETSMAEAKRRGAMALFGEKYGDEVRVVAVPGFSVELCGGTHARRTGDIGLFRITGESGIAAGVRRIEAQTGPGALRWARQRDAWLDEAAAQLRAAPDELAGTILRLSDDRRRLQAELEAAKRELARAKAGDLLAQVREVGGVRVLATELQADAATLRDEADRLRDQLGSGVVVLGARDADGVKLVVVVSRDLAGKRVHAGNLVKELARRVGGSGGGRPDMAQAGGKDGDALPAALAAVYDLVGA